MVEHQLVTLKVAGSNPVGSALGGNMGSKYESWSTEELLEEIKRLKLRLKGSLTEYGAGPDKSKLLAIAKVLERRRKNP